MTIISGTRIGPYDVTGLLGVGGMGEVYRARDTKLNRDVALKVLPEAFALEPDRLARFKREAQVLASLNHQNIAAIYGFEDSGSTHALVLELVEGPTLADRIASGGPEGPPLQQAGESDHRDRRGGPLGPPVRVEGRRPVGRRGGPLGPPIPIDEALSIAKQIADALEAAHEHGIMHRDLKPANIKLRPDGVVKVLDFGLAKAFDVHDDVGTGAGRPDMTASPTLSIAATRMGVILGTAAYMAPEQARGKRVDRRADVWAFGCVLYEMITGRRAFAGDEISDTLAFVLTKEPDWSALPAAVPTALRRLLRSCLEKDPRRRLQAIGDARLEIEHLLAGEVEEAAAPAIAPAIPPWRRALAWSVATALGLIVGSAVVLVWWAPWRTAPPAAPVRVEASIGVDASLASLSAALASSPDGSILTFAAQNSQGTQQLYLRRLGDLRAVPLAGTVNARNPFFSPDGQWIGFFADGKLKKVAVAGGAAVTLCDAADDRGGTWAEDGSIVFQPSANGPLMRVLSAGGTPAPLTKLAAGELTQRWPQVLPGGRAVLYTGHNSTTGFEDANIVVQPLPDGVPKIVQRGGYYGRYLKSGHLVYMQQRTLFAEPFDLARLEPAGQPVPVLEGISAYAGGGSGAGFGGSAQVTWSEAGTATYLAEQSADDVAPIQWMDRTGTLLPLRPAPSNWSNPSVAPDGRRLALDIATGQPDVWVYEWARDTLTRVTFDAATDRKPVWTPDGARIAFASNRTGAFNLYWQRADGAGDVQRLTETQNAQTPSSWHPSGKFLAFYESRQTGNDLMILPMDGDEASGWKPGKPTVFLGTSFVEFEPMFSPDGRWIAYQSNESGRYEVYVRPFPGPGGKWQISTDGGLNAIWSRTRHELLYAGLDNRLMVTSYTVEGDSFRSEKPRVWSERRFMPRPRLRSFDLHPDGERVVLAAAPENAGVVKQDKVVFIFNFFDELRRLAPPGTR